MSMEWKTELDKILDGIDRDDSDGGWWETSTGVDFGARKKQEVIALIESLFPIDYSVCQNCGETLGMDSNTCPNCGHENVHPDTLKSCDGSMQTKYRKTAEWTTDAPTDAGFYWLRNFQFDDEDLIHSELCIILISGSFHSTLEFSFTGNDEIFDVDSTISGEWCKIEPPPNNLNINISHKIILL